MSETNERSGASAGSVEPVAWAVAWDDGIVVDSHIYCERDVAERWAKRDGGRVVRLYRSPNLTDAELEAIQQAIYCCEDITYGGAANQEAADVLNSLLERLK